MMTRSTLAGATFLGLVALGFQQAPNKAKIQQDLKDAIAGPWIYDDIDAGFAAAKKAGKPMLVVFR
ncbi:MAG: hypothetical protein ACRD96_15480 [Bryobacteraceae bacterium]